MIEDYSDKGYKSSLLISKDSLMRLANLLAEKSFQMNTHAIGDAANRVVLEVYNRVLAERGPRWRIEHAQVIAEEDFPMFNTKIIPSVQPIHAVSDKDWAIDRLGAERLKTLMHTRTCWIGLESWHSVLISQLKTSIPSKPSMLRSLEKSQVKNLQKLFSPKTPYLVMKPF